MRLKGRRALCALLLATIAVATPGIATAGPALQAGQDIRDRLEAVPGLTVVSERPVAGFRFFTLTFRQPVDHLRPWRGSFEQRLTLLHASTDRPMVLHTTGYYVPTRPFRSEPTRLIDGNQLSMEHRFFLPSRPQPADWDDLDIWQMATDQHRVVQALDRIYREPWVTTGASKGGMTAVYFRRFYPRDVDATVAYVAPNDAVNRNDRALDEFFLEVGDDEACRAALRDLQREALRRRPELVARYQAFADANGLTFDQVLGNADRAFEMMVLDSVWAFWQFSGEADCATVPPVTASSDELMAFLDRIASLAFYTDQGLRPFEPYFFQAAEQLGWPSLRFRHLRGLRHYPRIYQAKSSIPEDVPVPRFQPWVMRDVDRWVRHHGERMLFIYGENDPWSAEAFRVGRRADSFVYVAPGTNHGADIDDLAPADAAAATATLRRWMGVAGETAALTTARIPALDGWSPRDLRRPL